MAPATRTHDPIPSDDLAHRIRSFLAGSPDLLKPNYRSQLDRGPFDGHCYVASEAYFHANGGYDADYTVHRLSIENTTHWFLRDSTGAIHDVTADQFETPIPYDDAVATGFLTDTPSKRAQTVLDAVTADTTGTTTIGVDIDGVLAEQNEAFCEYIETEHGIDFPVERVDCRNPDIPEIGSTYADQIQAAQSQPGFYESMQPLPGAADAIRRLYERPEYTIAIVTHREYGHAEETLAWLDAHDIPYDYFYVDAPANKGEFAIDVLIDDYPKNLQRAVGESDCLGVGFLRRSNHEFYPHSDIETAADCADVSSESLVGQPRRQWKLISDRLVESPIQA